MKSSRMSAKTANANATPKLVVAMTKKAASTSSRRWLHATAQGEGSRC